MIDSYKVFTVFCDGQSQDHDHDEVGAAAKEYALKVAEAVAPETGESGHPDVRHVRRVEFLAFDEKGERVQYTSQGPFPCADTTGNA
jgi:hypothetical protein